MHSRDLSGGPSGSSLLSARNDLIAGAVTVGAIILFVATGSRVLLPIMSGSLYDSMVPDVIAGPAVILNIALILFAWRRYRDIRAEVQLRSAAEERARLLASRDQLTQLLIRTSVCEQAPQLLEAAKAAGQAVGMIVVNLDRFRNVNEIYGHIAGDFVLRSAADIVLRISPPDSLCARLGADEFCILMRFEEEDERSVANAAEQLVRLLGEPFEVNTIAIHVGASVGMARTETTCFEVEGLLRRGHIAMNSAKTLGGKRALWFDRTMESVLKARNEVEGGLRRGIPLGEFLPFYQPQFDLHTEQLRGFEALARWEHPTGGIVGPDVFIPVAEETGLIAPLFESIFVQALGEARGWDSSLTLSVNISPGQLKDPWLAQKVLKILTESGFPAERLEIEITESSLFENLPLAQAIVASLKNQGVRLALDDFGTGYSSLANLRALPFDRIKIDRSFVQTMHNVRESQAIVTAVAKIGESLGVPVTAEGVETAETAALLREIGCDMGQGWYYGRPVTAEETHRLLSEHGLLVPYARHAPAAFRDDPEAERSAA
ncbi:MAG: diguanylate cyclase/phosphodiesterase [Alphaproteobacteria bacterium]|nr:diguanylate cyclase/phosphodiesterase [Alphaproteobacteria bacterium]